MMLPEMTSSARVARAFQRLARGAVVGLALGGLAGCGGGGSSTPAQTTQTPETRNPEMTVTPSAPPAPTMDQLEAAPLITSGDPVSGTLSSPTDVNFYRLALTGPSRVTFWTTGEAETVVTLFDEDGKDLSAAGASASPRTTGGGAALAAASAAVPAASVGRVSVTTGLDDVFARVTGREGGRGDYALHHEPARPGRPASGSPSRARCCPSAARPACPPARCPSPSPRRTPSASSLSKS